MKPIIPWPGGKRRLVDQILATAPEHQCYVEAFAGGAAVLFSKAPAPVEVLNDFNGDLVCLYRCVQHHLDEFVRQFRWALTSRAMFDWAKLTDPRTLTDIQRAARFFYLQKTCFGAKVAGQTFGYSPTSPPKLNLLRLEEDLSAAHLRLSRVLVENVPWQDCVARYDRPATWFFLDPPYWGTEGYGVDFGWDQYERLAEVMASLKGRATLTLNDHPDIRRLFAGFPSKVAKITYTIGGGKTAKPARELLIFNRK